MLLIQLVPLLILTDEQFVEVVEVGGGWIMAWLLDNRGSVTGRSLAEVTVSEIFSIASREPLDCRLALIVLEEDPEKGVLGRPSSQV